MANANRRPQPIVLPTCVLLQARAPGAETRQAPLRPKRMMLQPDTVPPLVT